MAASEVNGVIRALRSNGRHRSNRVAFTHAERIAATVLHAFLGQRRRGETRERIARRIEQNKLSETQTVIHIIPTRCVHHRTQRVPATVTASLCLRPISLARARGAAPAISAPRFCTARRLHRPPDATPDERGSCQHNNCDTDRIDVRRKTAHAAPPKPSACPPR